VGSSGTPAKPGGTVQEVILRKSIIGRTSQEKRIWPRRNLIAVNRTST
jgi:hypothetical protein